MLHYVYECVYEFKYRLQRSFKNKLDAKNNKYVSFLIICVIFFSTY